METIDLEPFQGAGLPEGPLARDVYFEMCRIERWSVLQLGERIPSVERTISRPPSSREIERFLLELRVGFTFVEREKRMTLDGDSRRRVPDRVAAPEAPRRAPAQGHENARNRVVEGNLGAQR